MNEDEKTNHLFFVHGWLTREVDKNIKLLNVIQMELASAKLQLEYIKSRNDR
jgi:hypothetical protein